MKVRMGEAAPAVIFGCGDTLLLERSGLAVVVSEMSMPP